MSETSDLTPLPAEAAETSPAPVTFDYATVKRNAEEVVRTLKSYEGKIAPKEGELSEYLEICRLGMLDAVQRIADLPEPPPGPVTLNPGETEASVRRRIDRLRRRMNDKTPDERALQQAEILERRATFRKGYREAREDLHLVSALTAICLWTYYTQRAHSLKRLPKELDPEGDVAAWVRAYHRNLRRLVGRPRQEGPKRSRHGRRRRLPKARPPES
jgi:hypothetical protein